MWASRRDLRETIVGSPLAPFVFQRSHIKTIESDESGNEMDRGSLKILLFSEKFEARGTSAYTLRLARNLPEHGFELSVITPNAACVDPEVRKNLHIEEYPDLEIPIWKRRFPAVLSKKYRNEPPVLLHIQSRGVLNPGTKLSRYLQIPCILTVHDAVPSSTRLKLDKGLCKKVIAVSEHVKETLLEHHAWLGEKIAMIHSGVEPKTNAKKNPALSPGQTPVIGTAGPLEAVKGFPFFLSAAQKILSEGFEAYFLVAGAGPEEFNLRRLAEDLGIEKSVSFLSGLHDFDRSLAAIDIFCLTSLKQGLGTVMLDAMSRQIPVIASAVGGVADILEDNKSGLLVPPANSDKLAERILELLRNPVRARSIGQEGHRTVLNKFGVEKMIERTVAVYRSVLEESNRPENRNIENSTA